MQRIQRNPTLWTRRLIGTAIILAAAAGLAYWGSQREGKRYDAIRTRITMLCESLAGSNEITWQYDWADPAVAKEVMLRIRDIMTTVPAGQTDVLRIEVAPKGLAPFERGNATHEALIFVADQPRLGLMIEAGQQTDQMRIVGFWEPAAN